MITERAYAKLNLTLEVIRKRDDGYHDLASIMQTVDLYDELEFSESEEIEFNCSDGALSSDDNLVVKAANALRETAEVQQGVKITLTKHIPVAAGLGGGSADAAATLRGLNRLWGLSLNEQQLIDVANRVGSDVPFLVSSGTAMVSGRGETLERLPSPEIARLVIVSPRHSDESRRFSGRNVHPEGLEEGCARQDSEISKTARMFGMLSPATHTTGSLTRKLAARMMEGGDCHPAFMFNVFQQVAPRAFPDWQAAYDTFTRLGASDIILTGAGPSMFAIAPSKEIGTAWALVAKTRTNCEAFSVALAPRIQIGQDK